MAFRFLELPGELRNEAYKWFLVRGGPIDPVFDNSSRPRYRVPASLRNGSTDLSLSSTTSSGIRGLIPNVLRTNSVVFQEATSFLYANNIFNLSALDLDCISAFFTSIGIGNAGQIRHVRVHFPVVENVRGCLHVVEYDKNVLEIIKTHCPNLKCLTTAAESSVSHIRHLARAADRTTFDNALREINTQFRTIPTLEQVIIELPEGILDSDTGRTMQDLGWKLKAVPAQPRQGKLDIPGSNESVSTM